MIIILAAWLFLMFYGCVVALIWNEYTHRPKSKPYVKLSAADVADMDRYLPKHNPNKLQGYSNWYGINGIHQWLYWHLQKYPEGKIPEQQAVFMFNGEFKNTITLYNGQNQAGIAMLKEAKAALDNKTKAKPHYQYYNSIASHCGNITKAAMAIQRGAK